MTTTPTSPLESAYAALAAHDKACRALFAELDHQVCMAGPETLALWTSVLYALDAARVTAAQMLAYLPEPGPTQDQEPTLQEQYNNGFLTVAEYDRLVAEEQTTVEAAHNAEPPIMLTPETMERHDDGSVTLTFTAEPAPAFSDAGTLAFYSRKMDVGA